MTGSDSGGFFCLFFLFAGQEVCFSLRRRSFVKTGRIHFPVTPQLSYLQVLCLSDTSKSSGIYSE